MEQAEENNAEIFTPRDYQIEIFETAKKQNTIACLGTGTGKTFIAVLLIRENASACRKDYLDGGKRIFFLVPTVPLATQQAKTIKQHTDLKVKAYYGELGIDSWNDEKWLKEFIDVEILVMTAEVFRIIVHHCFIACNKIQLLIIDECHRAKNDHPYRSALAFFPTDSKDMPRIFGLSASLLNGKCNPTNLEKELKTLEKNLRATIATSSDLVDLQRYGTDPKEYIILYCQSSENYKDIQSKLADFINKLAIKQNEEAKSETPQTQEEHWLNTFSQEEKVKFFQKPLKCIKSLSQMLESLGPWCTFTAAEMYKREVKSLLESRLGAKHKSTLTEIIQFLDCICNMCETLNAGCLCFETMPHKLQRLLSILSAARKSPLFLDNLNPVVIDVSFEENPPKHFSALKKQKESQETQLSILIFVEQRITAYVLCQWILEVKQRIPELSFLEPEYIVGHGSVGASEASMSEKIQQKKLKQFRENRTNILVATQVLEEGMDIRQCNLVIRFDKPIDFRSYIQSKGRARARNSIYALLLEDGEKFKDFINDLHNFKTIEKMLQANCHNREMPSEEEINESRNDYEIPPYRPRGEDGPSIIMSAAISLINRYCASLPSDMATKLTPQWRMEIEDEDSNAKEYTCVLQMPINSPLRQPIRSDPMTRKKFAKMSAALKACKMLDELGEFNEHLVPAKSVALENAIEEEVGELEVTAAGSPAPGTNKRRQIYDRRVPNCMKNARPTPQHSCYIYRLKLDLITPLPKCLNPRNRPIDNPEDSPRGIAFLSTKKWPSVCPFTIFTRFGKMLVSFNAFEEEILLTSEDIQKIETFHSFVFSEALFLASRKSFSPNSAELSYYIVPIVKENTSDYTIDWAFIDTVKAHPYHEKKHKMPNIQRTVFSEEEFVDAVLVRIYKSDQWKDPTFHHVIRIMKDLTPLSMLTSKLKTVSFKDYFQNKYNVDVKVDGQPLVETVQYVGKSMWKPLYVDPREIFSDAFESNTKQRRKDYREYLIPELCLVHPFPSSFFKKVSCLPTVLFRLRALFLAEEIRQMVAREALVGSPRDDLQWPPFHLETSDARMTEKLVEKGQLDASAVTKKKFLSADIVKEGPFKITSFEVKVDMQHCIGPDPSLLLHAITAKSAGDEFDLERLEMIGDSFLKFAMTIKIYMKYQGFDEGKLTSLRSKLIQNLNLYQKAKEKGLGDYMTTTAFSCASTWLPPCYTKFETVDERCLNPPKKRKREKSPRGDNPQKLQKLNIPIQEESVQENEEEEEPVSNMYFTKQVISDKCIADSVEALIGAYLLSCGHQGALRFLAWMGLNPLNNKDYEDKDFDTWPPSPPSPIINNQISSNTLQPLLSELTSGFDKFEESINYRFKNKAYLLQAFTHPSYFYNNITDCYQRLEFLGDAVLDYLITRQLYEDPTGHSPGKLTDLRSALVNNTFFAFLAVHFGYDKFLKLYSPNLFRLINDYTTVLKNSEEFKFFDVHLYNNLAEVECFELDEVEVPKALGDLFESVAGAIYLDSGMSLDAVWKVCYPMIEPSLNHLSQHVPMSPVRELYELVQSQDIFKEAVEHKDGKTYIKAHLPSGKEYCGVGPNKKVAKNSAAKRALADLRPVSPYNKLG